MRPSLLGLCLFLCGACLDRQGRSAPVEEAPRGSQVCLSDEKGALCARRWPLYTVGSDGRPTRQNAAWVNRVSPELRALLQDSRAHDTGVDGGISPAGRACVPVVIELTGPPADLEELTFRADTVIPSSTGAEAIATGTVAVECIDELANSGHVTRISAPEQYEPL